MCLGVAKVDSYFKNVSMLDFLFDIVVVYTI